MANIKSMFSKISSESNSANSSEKENVGGSKKQTIEKIYQKKTQLEHILLRPDSYIGSVEKIRENMWIYDNENECMVKKEIEYVPGLYKIFDEILVNAADNKIRDKTMDCIKIDINQETNNISVWNNGQGIPVVMHKEENMLVPTMIFGHLMTSSNYNDEEEKVTGGRNGYGAKLCNIFSTKFTVETATKEYKKQFKQSWASNMTKASEPKVKEFFGQDFTKITFSPDLTKFKMDKLDEDIVALMSRRAYDVAATARGIKVFLNGKRLPIKNFKDYVDLYVKKRDDDISSNNIKIIYESPNDHWEVAVGLSENEFQQMSFVNSIATTKGGRHVDYVVDMICKHLITILKKNKDGHNVKPAQVKNHMWIFINCLIVNPAFDSQTKENMILQMKSFGSKCNLSEKFFKQVQKSRIIELVLAWANKKSEIELERLGGSKKTKKVNFPKLQHAAKINTKEHLKCTLILTEGDSAKSLAISGLGVVGRDYYGVFPLKGKLLNVRDLKDKQMTENEEISKLIQILQLKRGKKYQTKQDMESLSYGKVMIMTDQDQDGSHIKGLIINLIHYMCPDLLQQNYLEEFITPIVKATKRNMVLSFYSMPEFNEWKAMTPNHNTFNIKYYKGLGTSTSQEAKEYFSNMERHRITFRYQGQQDDDHIVLAFSKKHIEHRKEWLTNFMVDNKRRKELGLPEKYLYEKDTKFITYSDFINLELILFSNADNIRSIPSLVDGLKPGQRKVMFTCFKRNDKREVKVAQLAGSVAEQSAYHHGEASLCMTIVNLAQNYVGSNNLNLLEPLGQFGTRLCGGKDCASARYIFTKMTPLTRIIFNPKDDALLKHEYDDNQKIEPVWYIPIIPMVLVNGADGIGTGWMTKIPNYNPREIVTNIRRMLNNEEPLEMLPWYKNFHGTIEVCGDTRYVISGEVSIINDDTIEITELPVGTWTQNYKESVINPLCRDSDKTKTIIKDYKEYHTDTTVKFIIQLLPGELQKLIQDGLHKVFKLQTLISTTSMCVFDELGCIRRFDSVIDILKEFFKLRLTMYQKRKDYMIGILKAEADKLSNQARFIMEKCNGDVVVENKKRKTIIDELVKRGYDSDPVMEWKKRIKAEEDDDAVPDEENDSQTEQDSHSSTSSLITNKNNDQDVDLKKFDYLLSMSMWMLTIERKNELLKQRDSKLLELEQFKNKTKEDLWREDLDIFLEQLDKVEEKERLDQISTEKKIGKKTKKDGKKKTTLMETMPSPMSKRVEPTISDDLKKRIQVANKSKENKGKRAAQKENNIDIEEKDEFDLMVNNKKTIKDKLGTPEEIEKKTKVKRSKDGLKQTKLNFKKVTESPKKRGKKKVSDSEDSISDSDVEFSNVNSVVKERILNRRAATKITKYNLSDDDNAKSSENEEIFVDNEAIKDYSSTQQKMNISSASEDDIPQKLNSTSEDLFDSLVGRKKNESIEPKKTITTTTKRKKAISDDDDDDYFIDDSESEDDAIKKNHYKKKKVESSKNGKNEKSKGTAVSKTKRTKKTKKILDNDDDDFEICVKETTKNTKVAKVLKDSEDSASDDYLIPQNKKESSTDINIDVDSPISKTVRSGRNKKITKYNFSDSDEFD